MSGSDDRLLAVVGPCSIHDTKAALDYAARLKATADTVQSEICVVMRVYFEKPRTIVGWKGLINDPYLDNTFQINEGLKLARGLLSELADMGLAAGTEYLDLISPPIFGGPRVLGRDWRENNGKPNSSRAGLWFVMPRRL